MEASFSDFKTAASQLNAVDPTAGIYSNVVSQINTTYDIDKTKNVTTLSAQELEEFTQVLAFVKSQKKLINLDPF